MAFAVGKRMYKIEVRFEVGKGLPFGAIYRSFGCPEG